MSKIQDHACFNRCAAGADANAVIFNFTCGSCSNKNVRAEIGSNGEMIICYNNIKDEAEKLHNKDDKRLVNEIIAEIMAGLMVHEASHCLQLKVDKPFAKKEKNKEIDPKECLESLWRELEAYYCENKTFGKTVDFDKLYLDAVDSSCSLNFVHQLM